MIFVGIDRSEDHHEVCVLDVRGMVLTKGKVGDDVAGVGRLHAMVAEHVEEPSEVVVGIETDRGLLVGSLVEAGYHVSAINPFAASRYRDRHSVSGAKSDPGMPRSSPSSPRVLKVTRTPRSLPVFPESALSSAPGSSRSSETTRPATTMREPDAATREPRRSPGPRERVWWFRRGLQGTGGCSMPATYGRSPRSTAPPGARRSYDAHRARGKTHHQALRALANRWVGILHGCLTHHELYREDVAWIASAEVAA